MQLTHNDCVHKHPITRLFPTTIAEWLSPQCCYEGCVANEQVALHNRHLVRRLEPVRRTVAAVAKHWLTLFPEQSNYRAYSWEELLQNTTPAKIQRTKSAIALYHQEGVNMKDARVRAFIKHEKGLDDPEDDAERKDPRLIQYRSFKWTTLFKKVLGPFEHHLWAIGNDFTEKAPMCERMFSKGMNSFSIAANLRHGWDTVPDPVADLWDVSRMDAHLGQFVRELIEFPTYYKTGNRAGFAPFITAMRTNKGWTRGGIKYTSRYTMCSGEACTSAGDSIVMAAALKYIYRDVPHHILVCGDDSVVIRPNGFVPDRTVFEELGLPTKYESAELFEHVEFCQSRPVNLGHAWRMVRNPDRVLGRTQYTIKDFPTTMAFADYLASVGRGELASNDGVPILQSFAEALCKVGQWRTTHLEEFRHRHEIFNGVTPVTDTARASFALAWGWSPESQSTFESHYARGGAIGLCVERRLPG